jgi:hypothetical protein
VAQYGDLVPKRDDLDPLGTITTPEQHQKLQDTTEYEVKHGQEHEQPRCPLPVHVPTAKPQVEDTGPDFRTHRVFGEINPSTRGSPCLGANVHPVDHGCSNGARAHGDGQQPCSHVATAESRRTSP